jgi:hypothetical protein
LPGAQRLVQQIKTMRNFHILALVVVGAMATDLLYACGSTDAASTLPPASPDGSISANDGSAANDASTTPGPNGSVVADGGVDPPDAGPGGDTSQLTCGTASCAIPAQTCCIAPVPGDPNRSYSCVVGSTCPRPDGGGGRGDGEIVALKCSSGANCGAGTVCCVTQSNGVTSSECKATCGQDEAQLCDQKAADAGTGCPQNAPCSHDNIGDWGLPRTYATCGGKGN